MGTKSVICQTSGRKLSLKEPSQNMVENPQLSTRENMYNNYDNYDTDDDHLKRFIEKVNQNPEDGNAHNEYGKRLFELVLCKITTNFIRITIKMLNIIFVRLHL